MDWQKRFKLLGYYMPFYQWKFWIHQDCNRNNLQNILTEYEISNKIFKIITDNGRNIVKAISLFENDEDEFDSDIDVEALEELKQNDSNKNNESEASQTTEFLKTQTEFIAAIDNLYGKQHMRCFIHTLQLVINDGKLLLYFYFKYLCKIIIFFLLYLALNEISKVKVALAKVLKIAAKSRQNSAFGTFIRDGGYNYIPKPIKTRCFKHWKKWFGWSLKDQGFENLVLTNTEYNNLTSLAQILEKFEEITEITEGDKYSTVSMVIPSVYLLREHH